MTILSVLGECLLVLALFALAVFSPAPSVQAWVLFGTSWGISFLAWMGRQVGVGGHRWDRGLFLISFFFLAMPLLDQREADAVSWWPLAFAGLLSLFGLVAGIDDRRKDRAWSQTRKDVSLAVIILLLASGGTAALARAILTFRSQVGMTPGRVDFLIAMGIWAGAWFGLDAALRVATQSTRAGALGWCWNRRHALLIGLTALVILLRSWWYV